MHTRLPIWASPASSPPSTAGDRPRPLKLTFDPPRARALPSRPVSARTRRNADCARGWSQEELAFQSGLHRTFISGIERGARNPTVTVLKELADALGATPSRLLDGGALPRR